MNTGMIHCRLYSPVGMIPVTALQKTRNVPVCPPSKLSSSLLNQVFHCISRYLLGVPKPCILLWFFFFLPPLHQLICQFMQISLQQTFFFFPTSNVWSTCGYKGPDPLLQLKGHPRFRSSSGLAQFSAATAFQFNFSLCLILTFSKPKRCFWEHSSTNFLHNHLRVSIYFLGNSIYDVSFPCPLLHPGVYPHYFLLGILWMHYNWLLSSLAPHLYSINTTIDKLFIPKHSSNHAVFLLKNVGAP